MTESTDISSIPSAAGCIVVFAIDTDTDSLFRLNSMEFFSFPLYSLLKAKSLMK